MQGGVQTVSDAIFPVGATLCIVRDLVGSNDKAKIAISSRPTGLSSKGNPRGIHQLGQRGQGQQAASSCTTTLTATCGGVRMNCCANVRQRMHWPREVLKYTVKYKLLRILYASTGIVLAARNPPSKRCCLDVDSGATPGTRSSVDCAAKGNYYIP